MCKEAITEYNGRAKVSAFDIFAAGTIASVPAAILTTPADVIKTRLQAIPRPGETSYNSIRDCAVKIFQNEGYMAFFQGSWMRTLRIAPQFGLTLWAYESLMNGLGLEKACVAPTTAPIDPLDYRGAFLDGGP
jgi:solute carrier family 25 aspartate/glutamate transporter 12/13